MAKKSRRARRQPTTGAQPVRPAQSAESTPVAQPVRVSRPVRPPAHEAPKEVDFAKEYHYVIADLKLTFLIAAALLVVMIVLAFILA